jgi:hypothetical protein
MSNGAALDLTGGKLVIDYSGSSPLSSIVGQIATAYASGNWTGAGITSTNAAAASTTSHKTALGYAEASQLGVSTFAGQSVDSTAVLIRYTATGDSNLDGTVDLTDFTYLAANFNGSTKNWLQGDYNYDGSVDLTDFSMLASNFNYTPATTIGVFVPEPAALSILPLGGLLLRRRRQFR